ncbi:hypothetical protein [Bosea sp. NBC_00550]|uniref:hypothetical protein n=1 Tax=Bosea sp. NBC_00550 TaxID=2969621 RepID=UPI0022327E2D|nr:hypothetical protein [Bosea sp. NBC_00550]UZF95645.1 hypothetical protein NWE53_29780 [Bosea sp. NBC_00550]
MTITSHAEYRAAVERAAAISDATDGSEGADEFTRLTSEIRQWDEAHKGDNAHGPDADQSLLRPDDLPFSGLPGNLGKLHKD